MRKKYLFKMVLLGVSLITCLSFVGCDEKEKVVNDKKVVDNKKDINEEFEEPMNIQENSITEEELAQISEIDFEKFVNTYKEFSASGIKVTNQLMASTESVDIATCESLMNDYSLKLDSVLEVAPEFLVKDINEYYTKYNEFYTKVIDAGKYDMNYYSDFSKVDNLRYEIDNTILAAIQKLELNISLY